MRQSTAKIRELTLGTKKTVAVGGQNALAFHSFEGTLPNGPKIAMEVYDTTPADWADELKSVLGDVWGDPVAWAKKCEGEFGADLICLQLAGTDPNGANRSVADAVATVKAVVDAISVPLMVYGSGNVEKDAELLKAVAEATQGKNVVIGAGGRGELQVDRRGGDGLRREGLGGDPDRRQHGQAAEHPADEPRRPAGQPADRPVDGRARLRSGVLLLDPRADQARGAQAERRDAAGARRSPTSARRSGAPRRRRSSQAEAPQWGDGRKRGIVWETLTATAVMMAGADILIMRHPEAVKLIRKTIAELGA